MMTIDDIIEDLIARFPRDGEQIKAWTRDYAKMLGHLDGTELEASFDATLGRWTKGWPPRPADFKQMKQQGHKRHPLFVAPHRAYNQMTDAEFGEWRRQNAELFLVRLPYWWKMSGKRLPDRHDRPMGEEGAARILKTCQNDDECYRVFDQWRHGESLDPQREPVYEPEKVLAVLAELAEHLRQNRGMDPRITPECQAFMRDYDRRMAEKRTGPMVRALRGPAEEHRSDLPGAVARRAALQQAADTHRRGVLDGTIKLVADYRL